MTRSLDCQRDPQVALSRRIMSQCLTYTDSGRLMGWHLMGGPGGGKSRLGGRYLIPQDIYRGVPGVIIDPNVATIDNTIDQLARQPRREQEYYAERLRYVDMSGRRGYITPWPLLYPAYPGESLYRQARRFTAALQRLDPALASAPILGLNSVKTIATYTGIILAALGYQFTEARHLLDHPELWRSRLEWARQRYPLEVADAYTFFTDIYPNLHKSQRDTLTSSFRGKLDDLLLDPTSRAMFGARQMGIDWGEVVDKRLCVLLDFSGEIDADLLRFKMWWVFISFLSFVHTRGIGHRHRPIALFIDELANMFHAGGADLFAADLDRLINVTARNYGVWVTVAHQELYQFPDERIRKSLMSMGTQIIGNTQDPDAAYTLARQFYEYDPTRYKRLEPVYGSSSMMGVTTHFVLDERPVDLAIQEQFLIESYQFLKREPLHFLVKTVSREGQRSAPVQYMSIAELDRGIWVNEEGVEQVKDLLVKRSGIPVQEVLTDIQSRVTDTPQHPPAALTHQADTDEGALDTMEIYGDPAHLSIPDDDDDILYEEKTPPASEAGRRG